MGILAVTIIATQPKNREKLRDSVTIFFSQTRSKFTLASRAAAVVEEEKNNVNNGREPKHIRKQTSLFSLGPLFNKHHQQNAKEPAPRVGSSKQYHHPPSPLAHSAAGNDDGRRQQCKDQNLKFYK